MAKFKYGANRWNEARKNAVKRGKRGAEQIQRNAEIGRQAYENQKAINNNKSFLGGVFTEDEGPPPVRSWMGGKKRRKRRRTRRRKKRTKGKRSSRRRKTRRRKTRRRRKRRR